MEPVVVYITASSREEAMLICDELLGKRLIACGNIIESMTALYWWAGAIERETECILIAKTLMGHVEALTERVKALHTYDCPCVIVLPIVAGNPDYLRWITEQATGKAPE